jgi:hypothetical protein
MVYGVCVCVLCVLGGIVPKLTRKCSKCPHIGPLSTDFYRNPNGKYGYLSHCKTCHSRITKAQLERWLSDPRQRMLKSSMSNAKRGCILHTLTLDDIILPETCVYLGIRIDYRTANKRGDRRHDDSPSIDRIDPTGGYVPGNVQVISDLANRMKQNATVEQLLAFAESVLRVHGRKKS